MNSRKYLNEIKESLRSTRPTAEQDELFRQVGRLVVALSRIEHELAVVYVSLCYSDPKNNPNDAAKKFFSLRFDDRLEAISEELEKASSSLGVDVNTWREFKDF